MESLPYQLSFEDTRFEALTRALGYLASRQDKLAAAAQQHACLICDEQIKDRCFIPKIPLNNQYEKGFKIWFQQQRAREHFISELEIDPDAVCFLYHPNRLVDN